MSDANHLNKLGAKKYSKIINERLKAAAFAGTQGN
jgi:DNA uptake protein ComE-like DNA-binding protein